MAHAILDLITNPVFFVSLFEATLFIELWKRKENMLKLRWNLFTVPADKTTR